MLSIASLQRTAAVLGLIAGLGWGEWLLISHGLAWLPDLLDRVVGLVGSFGLIWIVVRLEAWERRKRLEDEAEVARVVAAARSVGVELQEDRAIFPVFYRGRRSAG